MHDLLDIYQLADKYDIPALRRSAGDKFFELAYRDLSTLSGTSGSTFVDCIARICGPKSLQFADNTIKNRIMELCQEDCISLLRNKAFLQRYTKGELFDGGTAAAFGMGLGRHLLESKGIFAQEADGFPIIKSMHIHKQMERFVAIVIARGVLQEYQGCSDILQGT